MKSLPSSGSNGGIPNSVGHLVTHLVSRCPHCKFFNEEAISQEILYSIRKNKLLTIGDNGIVTCEACLLDYRVDLKGINEAHDYEELFGKFFGE